jgi:protease-4
MWSWIKRTMLVIIFIFGLMVVYKLVFSKSDDSDRPVSKNEILHLELKGVIMDGKKFLSQLKKYSKEDSVKAIVIDINSPGGAVGPSQEIYYEILRVKKETKKPVICVSTGLIASGGYYSALACDQILVAPGTMIGSIGVIMEFANLEGLYDWAKVKRYTITSGKFKDSGSEYRAMREDEKALFQDMINEVYQQFKTAVATSRDLKEDFVAQYADGRVMTGATAVKLKFADAHHLFKPRKERNSVLELLMDRDEEDDLNSLSQVAGLFGKSSAIQAGLVPLTVQKLLKLNLLNQPLYMMPGAWE